MLYTTINHKKINFEYKIGFTYPETGSCRTIICNIFLQAVNKKQEIEWCLIASSKSICSKDDKPYKDFGRRLALDKALSKLDIPDYHKREIINTYLNSTNKNNQVKTLELTSSRKSNMIFAHDTYLKIDNKKKFNKYMEMNKSINNKNLHYTILAKLNYRYD